MYYIHIYKLVFFMLWTGSRLDKESSTAAYLPPYVDGLAACKYLFQNALHVSVTCHVVSDWVALTWTQNCVSWNLLSFLGFYCVLTYCKCSFYSFKECCMHPNVCSTLIKWNEGPFIELEEKEDNLVKCDCYPSVCIWTRLNINLNFIYFQA